MIINGENIDLDTNLDISESHFWEIVEKYRSNKVWHKKNGKWQRKVIVSNSSLNGQAPTVE